MRLRLILDDTDIVRFNRWMDEEISVVEFAARVEQATGEYPYVLGGWSYLRDFRSHFEFCVFDDEDGYLAALDDRVKNIIEIDGKTYWSPRMKRNGAIQTVPPLVECTVDAEGYRLSQVIVEFWMDDKTNFYSTLLDIMERAFSIIECEEIDDDGNPLRSEHFTENELPTLDPAPAEPHSSPETGARDDAGGWTMPEGLKPVERAWLLICLQAELEWRHGMEYASFCRQTGINQKTYEGWKRNLTKTGRNLKAWIPNKKPVEMRAEVIKAIHDKQDPTWRDSGESQGNLRVNTGGNDPETSLQWLHD